MNRLVNLLEQLYWKVSRGFIGLTRYKIYIDDPITEFSADTFPQCVKNAKITLRREKNTWFLDMKMDTGELRRTYAFLEKPFDAARPTIIFHHGAGMINYKPLLWLYFAHGPLSPFNLISIKAQSHESTMKFAKTGFNTLNHQMATFAGSVLMVEALVQWTKKQGSKPVVMGASMGGIVTTWHWLIFNSAPLYFPITAYPNVTEIFLGNGYEGATDHRQERQQLASYNNAFHFQPKNPLPKRDKIFPILGEFDSIVPYKNAKQFWKEFKVKTFLHGHMTTALQYTSITCYIADIISEHLSKSTKTTE